MNNIIFLDVDGPLIPEGCFYLPRKSPVSMNASFERQFSPIAISLVKHIVDTTNFKIVMNTTHNVHDRYDHETNQKYNVKEDLLLNGFDEKDFHENWLTTYPDNSRYDAILDWIKENGETNWIAFDDAKFLDSENKDFDKLILIDFVLGVTPYTLDEFKVKVKKLYDVDYRPLYTL